MSVLSIRVLQNTQKVVICGRDSPNTQLNSIRPWTITAAYYYYIYVIICVGQWLMRCVAVAQVEKPASGRLGCVVLMLVFRVFPCASLGPNSKPGRLVFRESPFASV